MAKVKLNLFLLHHLLVKGEFGPFKNVSITAAGLSRSAGDFSQEAPGGELGVHGGLQSAGLLAKRELVSYLLGFFREILAGLLAVAALFDSALDSVM